MIKYRYLRYMAATGWGAVAMVLVLCGLWMFTELPVQDVVFYMIIVYGIVVGIILLFTEPQQKKPQKKPQKNQQRKKAQQRESSSFKIVTLRREDWK